MGWLSVMGTLADLFEWVVGSPYFLPGGKPSRDDREHQVRAAWPDERAPTTLVLSPVELPQRPSCTGDGKNHDGTMDTTGKGAETEC